MKLHVLHALYFDLPQPRAISHIWLVIFYLAWWFVDATPSTDFFILLSSMELLAYQNEDLASMIILAAAARYNVLFGFLYGYVWSRVHPRSLWYFVSKTALSIVFTVVTSSASLFYTVPMYPHAVTVQWLQSKSTEFNNVDKVRISPLGTGSGFIGETVRLKTFGKEAKSYIYKSSVTSNLLLKAKMRATTSVYWRESFFYHVVLPKLREKEGAQWGKKQMLQVPEVYINEYDVITGTSVLVMRDESGELEPGSEIVGATWQQTVSVAARYAQFHALHWSKSLDEMDNIRHPQLRVVGTFDWMDTLPSLVVSNLARQTFQDVVRDAEIRKCVPFAASRTFYRMTRNLSILFNYLKLTKQFTLVHGDARAENMLFPKQSPGTFVVQRNPEIDESYASQRWLALDFQTLTKSMGIFDLAYFVALDLTCEDACDDSPDRILVHYYLKQLKENGVVGYDFEEAWTDYKLCIMLSAMVPCVVMNPSSIGTEHADRARRTCAAMAKRCFAAMLRVGACEEMDTLLDRLLVMSTPSPPRNVFHTFSPQHTVVEHPQPQDDAFSHHTEESVAALPPPVRGLLGTGKLETYDRWYLNGYSADGSCYFALACGFYPGRGVVDASFSVHYNGLQSNLRTSRLSCLEDFGAKCTIVGPIQIEVTEALKSGRVRIKHEAIECDLTFTARFNAVLEPKFDMRIGTKMKFDYSRLTQLVCWTGKLDLCKEKKHFDVQQWHGTRDRSWGQRPHPNADRTATQNQVFAYLSNLSAVRALVRDVQFYWLWVPLNFSRLGGMAMHVQELGDGTKTNCAVRVFSTSKEEEEAVQRVEFAGKYIPGTRHLRECSIIVWLECGDRIEVECKPLFPFFMSGIGYGSSQFSHGSKPNNGVAYDEMCTVFADRNDNTYFQIQEISKLHVQRFSSNEGTCEMDSGIGIVEQFVIGPHQPSGFQGFYGV